LDRAIQNGAFSRTDHLGRLSRASQPVIDHLGHIPELLQSGPTIWIGPSRAAHFQSSTTWCGFSRAAPIHVPRCPSLSLALESGFDHLGRSFQSQLDFAPDHLEGPFRAAQPQTTTWIYVAERDNRADHLESLSRANLIVRPTIWMVHSERPNRKRPLGKCFRAAQPQPTTWIFPERPIRDRPFEAFFQSGSGSCVFRRGPSF
jgi:hypothetical protein